MSMASTNRHERQLMRQRGAAGRTLDGTDFGLNLAFGHNRDERQQMRQRGAGNRKVDAADFGITFPIAGRSSRSRSKTPGAQTSANRGTSRSGIRRSREPSIPLSRRSVSMQPTDTEARSAKRRRTVLAETYQNPPNDESYRAGAQPIDDGIDEEEGDAPYEMDAYKEPMLGRAMPSQLVDQYDFDKENDGASSQKTAKKRKKRKSIGQQSMRKKKRSSGESAADLDPSAPQAPSFAEPDSVLEAENKHVPSEVDMEEDSLMGGAAAEKTAPPRRRKKRKSVVLGKKKRRSSEGIAHNKRVVTASLELSQGPNYDDDQLEEDEAPILRKAQRPRANSADATQSSPAPVRSIEVEDNSDDEYVDEEHSPEPPTPASTKRLTKSKSTGNKRSGGASGTGNTSRRTSKTGLPITMYRMTNSQALPAIAEVNELEQYSDEEPDPTAHQSNFTDRAVPNAVDVLAQVCREVVANAVEKLALSNEASASDRRRKRVALQAFGDDLEDRLFEMSAAVEDRLNLEGRSRGVKRQKADLQSRWLEVRKQRERVALRCDRVRREHWESEREREDKWQISEAAYQTELELEQGEVLQHDSLEYLLRSVAGEVSTRADGSGLLNKIKAMNARLEKMAGVMEGRPV